MQYSVGKYCKVNNFIDAIPGYQNWVLLGGEWASRLRVSWLFVICTLVVKCLKIMVSFICINDSQVFLSCATKKNVNKRWQILSLGCEKDCWSKGFCNMRWGSYNITLSVPIWRHQVQWVHVNALRIISVAYELQVCLGLLEGLPLIKYYLSDFNSLGQ